MSGIGRSRKDKYEDYDWDRVKKLFVDTMERNKELEDILQDLKVSTDRERDILKDKIEQLRLESSEYKNRYNKEKANHEKTISEYQHMESLNRHLECKVNDLKTKLDVEELNHSDDVGKYKEILDATNSILNNYSISQIKRMTKQELVNLIIKLYE